MSNLGTFNANKVYIGESKLGKNSKTAVVGIRNDTKVDQALASSIEQFVGSRSWKLNMH
jgi:hypothetical protein